MHKLGQVTGSKTKSRARRHSRRSTIADMAVWLAANVIELSDDEHCRAGLTVAGFRPSAIAAQLTKVQAMARTTRAAEADIWSALRCR
jgi:hypothetical protein